MRAPPSGRAAVYNRLSEPLAPALTIREEGEEICIANSNNVSSSTSALSCARSTTDLENIVIEQPPNVEMGEFALPLSFELAKRLRKAPRKIAEEIVAGMPLPEGFEKLEVAGAGYINARLKREVAALRWRVTSTPAHRTMPVRARPTSAAKFWSSTPASIPTRPRTSAICATPFLAIPSCACCAPPDTRSTSRTTSTTPACRWPTWSSASIAAGEAEVESRRLRNADRAQLRASTTTAGTSTRACRSGTSRTRSI